MEIRLLATFKSVADNLSFHKAAEDLHYAQSTVSAQINAPGGRTGLPTVRKTRPANPADRSRGRAL